MRKSLLGVVLFAVWAPALFPAHAEDQGQSLPYSIEKRLREFDPEAIAAVRHYFTSSNSTDFDATYRALTEAMDSVVEGLN
jgi:hypothetical protein